MTKVNLASKIQEDSIVDGEGIRSVIWFQGCSHNCKGCHNPETHDFNGGKTYEIDEIEKWIDDLEDQDGITFSGGDPLMQPEALYELAVYTKGKKMNVWVYTGFTYEQIIDLAKTKSIYLDLLKVIDVLIDGKFEIENKSMNCKFRGSTNQRVINVKQTLDSGCIVKRYED